MRSGAGEAEEAGWDGFFPINLDHPEQLAEIVAQLSGLRDSTTWWLLAWPWESISVDLLRGAIRDGPATSKTFDRVGED
jgi:hypothetical protein